MDIHKGLGNANKIMNRLLYESFDFEIKLVSLQGGSLRNAIPRESKAILAVPISKLIVFENQIKEATETIKKEFQTVDPALSILLSECEKTHQKAMETHSFITLLKTLYTAHNGVYRMSPDISDLVETSNNLAKVTVENGQIKIECLTRSAVESSKMDLAEALRSAFELAKYEVTFAGSYPGWQPNLSSPILKVMTQIYSNDFQ